MVSLTSLTKVNLTPQAIPSDGHPSPPFPTLPNNGLPSFIKREQGAQHASRIGRVRTKDLRNQSGALASSGSSGRASLPSESQAGRPGPA